MWKFVGLALTILISIEHCSARGRAIPSAELAIRGVWKLFKTWDGEVLPRGQTSSAWAFITSLRTLRANIIITHSGLITSVSNPPGIRAIKTAANDIYGSKFENTFKSILQLQEYETTDAIRSGQSMTARSLFRLVYSTIPLLGELENMFFLGYTNGRFEPTRVILFEVENLFDKLDKVAKAKTNALPETRNAVRFARCVGIDAGTRNQLPAYDDVSTSISNCANQIYQQAYNNQRMFFDNSSMFTSGRLQRRIFDAFTILNEMCRLVGVERAPLRDYFTRVFNAYAQVLAIPEDYKTAYNTLADY